MHVSVRGQTFRISAALRINEKILPLPTDPAQRIQRLDNTSRRKNDDEDSSDETLSKHGFTSYDLRLETKEVLGAGHDDTTMQ